MVMGLAVAIIALSYAWFQHMGPNFAQAGKYVEWSEKLQAEEAKMPQAKKRVEDAKVLVQETSDKWQAVVNRRTPSTDVGSGGINLAVNRYQLTVDARKFRDSVQRAVNSQLKSGGVLVISGPRVPDAPETPEEVMPTYFNFPTTAFPVAIFDLGSVTVRGSWNQISENIRSWSRMPNYLAVADGLQISGTSPVLTATYNVTVVAYVRGKAISPEVQAVAASTPGAGVPGVPQGVPGPVPGRGDVGGR